MGAYREGGASGWRGGGEGGAYKQRGAYFLLDIFLLLRFTFVGVFIHMNYE
jgi:hypothetical protein